MKKTVIAETLEQAPEDPLDAVYEAIAKHHVEEMRKYLIHTKHRVMSGMLTRDIENANTKKEEK